MTLDEDGGSLQGGQRAWLEFRKASQVIFKLLQYAQT
jgi:uncharacterized protein YecT (DUF1311 family)